MQQVEQWRSRFLDWVESLIAQRPEIAPEENSEAIDAAVDELVGLVLSPSAR